MSRWHRAQSEKQVIDEALAIIRKIENPQKIRQICLDISGRAYCLYGYSASAIYSAIIEQLKNK